MENILLPEIFNNIFEFLENEIHSLAINSKYRTLITPLDI